MNIDEIKANWMNINERLSRLESAAADMQSKEVYYRRRTALEKLITQYTRFCRVCALFAVVFLVRSVTDMLYPGTDILPWWLQLMIALMCAAAALTDNYLRLELKRINLWTMGVNEVSNIVTRCRCLHLRWIICCTPVSLIMLGLIFYQVSGEQYTLAGAFVGLAIGLTIAVGAIIKFRRNYRDILSDAD